MAKITIMVEDCEDEPGKIVSYVSWDALPGNAVDLTPAQVAVIDCLAFMEAKSVNYSQALDKIRANATERQPDDQG